jgi:hypothetical protein
MRARIRCGKRRRQDHKGTAGATGNRNNRIKRRRRKIWVGIAGNTGGAKGRSAR